MSRSVYAENRQKKIRPRQRLIIELENEFVDRIDYYGAETGRVSRSEALRALINAGLDAWAKGRKE